jgi:hypothetical protein
MGLSGLVKLHSKATELELRAPRKRENRLPRKRANHGKDIALRKWLDRGSSPRMAHTSLWKAARSSSDSRTQVVTASNAGELLRSARSGPGKGTGMTRSRRPLSRTRRSMAALNSSSCQRPTPLGPTKTAHVSDSARALSTSHCQRLPGIKCHLSNQAWMPFFASRRANSSTAGLSAVL